MASEDADEYKPRHFKAVQPEAPADAPAEQTAAQVPARHQPPAQDPQPTTPTAPADKPAATPAATHHVNALDGVRALAIAAVVVYHANALWLPAGFLGVTVFFVLSGYLATCGLLRTAAREQAFDYKLYLCKRLHRLWPAMLEVVACTALLCAALAPTLLRKMQGDALPALLFFDNWWYIFRKVPYFAASGQPSPLTHFWYLGVLAQFYVVWPPAFCLLSRRVHGSLPRAGICLALAVASAVAMAPLGTGGLACMRPAVPATLKLAESMLSVELADRRHSCIPRLAPVAFVKSSAGPEVGDIYEHMDCVALRAVTPAAFLVEHVDRLMRRIAALKVFACVCKAAFRRELPAVDIALVGKEAEDLVVSKHGLCATRCPVMSICCPRGRHLFRPALLVRDIHRAVSEGLLPVEREVPAKGAHVSGAPDRHLLDRGHGPSPQS